MRTRPLHILSASDKILSGLTAHVNVKMTEMANQIKVGGVYHSQMLSAKRQFNVERERGKMKLQII